MKKNIGQLYSINNDYYLIRDETEKRFLNKPFDFREDAAKYGESMGLSFRGDLDENIIDIETESEVCRQQIINKTAGLNRKKLIDLISNL